MNPGGFFAEGGLCIVNIESIDQRHKRIKDNVEENEIINKESINFLSSLVSLCHGKESLKMMPLFELLGKTLIDGVVKNSSNMTYEEKHNNDNTNDHDNNNNKNNSDDSTEDDIDSNIIQDISMDVIKSALSSSSDIKEKLIKPIIKLLLGYNPFRLRENLYFVLCGNNSCPCTSFFKSTTLPFNINNPTIVLGNALRLFCHKSIDENEIERLEMGEFAIVPLKHILLSLIDSSSNFRTQVNVADFTATDIEPNNSQWINLLRNKIENISYEYRGFILLTYCALLFFPFCKQFQTFKMINLYIETILFKICYNAAEILFCTSTNSTQEKDNGKFINYINCYTVSNILSSPIRIEKAVDKFYRNQDLKQITSILTSIPNIYIQMNNTTTKKHIFAELARLYTPSTYIKSKHTSDVRNVRNVELFKILGEIKINNKTTSSSPPQVVIGNDIINRHSRGNNIRVNHFHILSMLPRVDKLSSDSKAQSYIDNYLEDNTQQQQEEQCASMGNFPGWWMGIIDGIINTTGSQLVYNKNISMRTILSDTIREVYKNRFISSSLMSQSFLPHQKMLTNNVNELLLFDNNKIEVQESNKLCVFSSWQTPTIIGANCSILAPIQIEMALTRSPEWNNYISKIMFFIERFNMDCYRGIFDKIFETENNKSPNFIENIPQLINGNFTYNNEYSKQMSTIFKEVFEMTKQQYVEGANISSSSSLISLPVNIGKYKIHEKRLYSFDKIYDILRDIIIHNNQNPQIYLQYSHELLTLFSEIDDFLMNTLKIKGYINSSSRCNSHHVRKRQKKYNTDNKIEEPMDTC
uniref:Wsv332-like protein n=1 Tax=Metapenaeus joyneri majanivirus TaxID=2984280 RepID=A0A9C7BIG7_9VIRU|nr:MAG: wsv332-like protein [Metapenaeus joyneri majanivirus]